MMRRPFLFAHTPLGMNLRNACIRNFNSPASILLAKNKLQFKQRLENSGFLTPQTLLVIHSYVQVKAIPEWPDEFVIKPNRGMSGNGVLVLKKEAGEFLLPSGERWTAGQLKRHIRKILDGEFSGSAEEDAALVEERIYPSETLKFNGMAGGLSDIRIFCYRFEPVMAMLRYTTARSRGLANLAQGAVGVGIDLATGRINHIHAKNHAASIGASELGIPNSFTMPYWGEMKEKASKASRISGLHLSGVDLILDAKDRVMVLETNGRPGLEIQNVNEDSLLERMEAIDRAHGSIESPLGTEVGITDVRSLAAGSVNALRNPTKS